LLAVGHQVLGQHMMPPPATYPGSGAGSQGKMYPSGMMMHPGGGGGVGMPSSSGMYTGQPYGAQPSHAGEILLPGISDLQSLLPLMLIVL